MNTKTDMDARILAIAAPVADDLGYNIVRVRVMGGNRSTVQIMAERKTDGQMEVSDCETLSRELSSTFEVEDPLHDAYVLEVSSPGLERPLTALKDYETYKGLLARVELDRLVEGRKRFRGTLAGTDGDMIDINLDGEAETAQIPFEWVTDAKLLITDDLIKAGQDARKAAAVTSDTKDEQTPE